LTCFTGIKVQILTQERRAEGLRLERRAEKARQWFVKQRDKLNEMVRQPLSY
jgi:hypothetical protein